MTPCVHPAEPEGRGVQRVWGASGLVPTPPTHPPHLLDLSSHLRRANRHSACPGGCLLTSFLTSLSLYLLHSRGGGRDRTFLLWEGRESHLKISIIDILLLPA